jgi:prepilin-type N-terminal cleavage/methylation domain-containing protein
MNKHIFKQGFTLIELLVVIAIIAVLVAFAATNYVGVRSRAKDIRKKAELSQLKNAMRLYYNDYAQYPATPTDVNDINGCGTSTPPATSCQAACEGQFAAGATGCDTVYMKLLPPESDYEWEYEVQSGGDDFCLWTTLEVTSDPEIAKSQDKCGSVCTGLSGSSTYVVCAD